MNEARAPLGKEGQVIFRRSEQGVEGLEVEISNVCVDGMNKGLHGFHVHESGNTTKGCSSMGAHYDPHNAERHGGPGDPHRHMGDLGNVASDENGCILNTTFHAPGLTIEEICGRGIVLHELKDDLGQEGTPSSLATGSAGARISCGTISCFQ